MTTRRDISGYERAVSALAGYVAGSMVVVPFDRVKTLMQASPGAHPPAREVARNVWRKEGLRGLYRSLAWDFQHSFWIFWCSSIMQSNTNIVRAKQKTVVKERECFWAPWTLSQLSWWAFSRWNGYTAVDLSATWASWVDPFVDPAHLVHAMKIDATKITTGKSA